MSDVDAAFPAPEPAARPAKSAARAWELLEHDARIRLETGARLLAGVDEVGRGALAGPLVAAAVILPHRFLIPSLDDSKALSPAARLAVAKRVTAAALCWSVAFVSAAAIDKIGLTAANMATMREAVRGLAVRPELTLSDGYPIKDCDFPNRSLVHGDRLSQTVAAAACVAKVARDAWMRALGEERYPGYGWERNAGYATAEHLRAVACLGLTPQHRRLFLRRIFPPSKPQGTSRVDIEQVGLPLADVN